MMLLVSDKKRIEISHYHYLVSAYVASPEMFELLREEVRGALKVARATAETQIVDQSGHGCLHVHPGGQVSVMMPVAQFDRVEDVDGEDGR